MIPDLAPENLRPLLVPPDNLSDANDQAAIAAALLEQLRYEHDPVTLDEAVALLTRALAATPPDHPDRVAHLINLGGALRTRFEKTEQVRDLNEALSAWAEATRTPVASAVIRLTAAHHRTYAIARFRHPAEAVEAFTEAVALLPLLAWRGITHHDALDLLQTYAASLACDAAACAITARPVGPAVELLEAGRGVHWSQLLGTRTDLTALGRKAPELAEQIRDCRAQLESLAPTEPGL